MTNKSLYDVVTWDSSNKSRLLLCGTLANIYCLRIGAYSQKKNTESIGCELNGLNRFGSIDRGCRFVTILFNFFNFR